MANKTDLENKKVRKAKKAIYKGYTSDKQCETKKEWVSSDGKYNYVFDCHYCQLKVLKHTKTKIKVVRRIDGGGGNVHLKFVIPKTEFKHFCAGCKQEVVVFCKRHHLHSEYKLGKNIL